MPDNYPLTKEEFETIYSKVPRLTVEVIVKNSDNAIYMTKRAIEPCKGQWHLPGGTVYFGESLLEAVKRIAKRELGIDVSEAINNGYIEYPGHYKNGLDCPVGLVFEAKDYNGNLVINNEAASSDWFTIIPENTHVDQDVYLVEQGYLKK